jgi:hypothetical protein
MSKIPEWLQISDLYSTRAAYMIRRKNLPRNYGIATMVFAISFFVASLAYHLPWPKSGITPLLALLVPLAGVVDWIWTTATIERYTSKIAKTGIDLRI